MRRNRDYDDHNQAAPGGPLLTNHLRDLDIELELLKRKREIIQQEQDIISRYSSKRQYDYEQPSNTYNRQESNKNQFNTNNYSARYDGPSSSGSFTRPQGPKRQTPNQYWQPPSATKNFTTTHKINPWQTSTPKQNTGFSNQKKFQPQQPRNAPIRPLMSIRPSIGQRVQNNFPNQRKDFRPSKVSKNKPQQGPNKLATYPVHEAKKLVSQAFDSAEKKYEADILRIDRTPSIQMKGRLELALGLVIKEIKKNHCSDSDDLEHFQSPFIQRLLKHTIRTRIRNVMIDQVVGNVNDIVDIYRKKYPSETDIELVQVAKDAQSLSSNTVGVAQLIESDDPEEFYKKNMTKAMTSKLEEMLANLEKLYMNKGKDLEEFLKNMPEPKNDNGKEKAEDSNINSSKGKEKVNFENIIAGEDILESISAKFSKVKFYKDFMDELIELRLPKILPKFKDMLLSIMLTDKEFLGTKAVITAQLKKKLMQSSEKELLAGPATKSPSNTETKISTIKSETTAVVTSGSNSTNDIPVSESSINTKTNISTTTSETPETTAILTPESTSTNETAMSTSEVSLTTETTILASSENNLPATSTETSEDVVLATTAPTADKPTENEKPVVSLSKASPKQSTTPNKVSIKENVSVTPTIPASAELYYIKLICRPTLPARAVIYDFLNKFNPASIKKHKSISNLLVIGFKNIEDYNEILTVNESVVGNATIVIKASEQVNKKPTASQSEIDENVSKPADQSVIDSSLISTELDNQITDLLTSIRKAEEQDKCDGADKTQTNDDDKTNISTTTEKTVVETIDEAKSDENLDIAETSDKINNSDKSSVEIKDSQEIITISDENNTPDINKDNSKTQEGKEDKELETITESNNEGKDESNIDKESKKPDSEKLKDNLKESGRATPTRSSSRLATATPSTIRTRRASRLAQNN